MISSSASSSSSSNGQCQRGHHDYHHAASWQTSSGHCVAYRRSKVPIWWQISCTRSLISAPALSRVGATRLPPARGPSLVTSATQLATKKIPRWRYQDAASGNILFPVDVEGRRERNQKKNRTKSLSPRPRFQGNADNVRSNKLSKNSPHIFIRNSLHLHFLTRSFQFT